MCGRGGIDSLVESVMILPSFCLPPVHFLPFIFSVGDFGTVLAICVVHCYVTPLLECSRLNRDSLYFSFSC